MVLTKGTDRMKTCTGCGKKKSLTSFYRNKAAKDGYQGRCKICHKEWARRYRKTHRKQRCERQRAFRRKHPGRSKRYYREKRYHLKQYDMTLDDYNRIFAEQDGCCAICGRHQSEFKRRLHVDHDHVSEKVRGLLCADCNFLLGHLERMERIGFPAKAKTYLSEQEK